MDYNTTYLKKTRYSEWDKIIEGMYGDIFYSSFYYKKISTALGVNFSIIVVENEQKEIQGGVIFSYKKIGPYKFQYILPAIPYREIVIKHRDSKFLARRERHYFSIIEAVIKKMKQDLVSFEFVLPPFKGDARPYTWNGLNSAVKYTYLLNFKKQSNWQKDYSSSLRRQIKKAEKLPFKIDTEFSEKNISIFYKLQKLSFTRQNLQFKISGKDFVNLIFEIHNKNKAYIFTIYKNTEAASSMIIFVSSGIAYYLFTGSNPNLFNSGLNSYLLNYVLSFLKEKKVEIFDFIGANTPSVAAYKANYGFTLEPIYHLSYSNWIYRFLFKMKKIIRP